MSCVVTPNLLQPVLFTLLPLETVATSIFLFSLSTLSGYDFFGFFTISVVTKFSFFMIGFLFWSLLLAELFVAT